MIYWRSVIFTFVFCVPFLLIIADDDDDGSYNVIFLEGTSPCSDFDNKKIVCDLQITTDTEYASLVGSVFIHEDIDDEDEVVLNVSKETEMGTNDPMFKVVSNICASIKESDVPWAPVFEALGISSCPIVSGEYKMNGVNLTLDFAAGVLTDKFVGDYSINLATQQKADMTSCHDLTCSIVKIE